MTRDISDAAREYEDQVIDHGEIYERVYAPLRQG